MKGRILAICPEAVVIDLTHGIVPFSVVDGAREFETIAYLPVGIHVCVVDPGVGTNRNAIIIETARGDYLVGPDSGVLIPATRRLGGVRRVISIEETKYVQPTFSRTFNGRDVFATIAGWLSRGVSVLELGRVVGEEHLVPSAFEEARVLGYRISAKVIHINRFGSAIFNMLEKNLSDLGISFGRMMSVMHPDGILVTALYARTFGAVPYQEAVMVPDDYGRIELAINMGSYASHYAIKLEDQIELVAQS